MWVKYFASVLKMFLLSSEEAIDNSFDNNVERGE